MKRQRDLGGLYLVVSPILPIDRLLFAVEEALKGGVDILQFSSSKETAETHVLADSLAGLAKERGVPFIVNNSLELAREVRAGGVHLDAFVVSPSEARRVIGSQAIIGYTVNVDLGKIKQMEQAGANYVSFCSIFRRCPGNECPIVSLDTVKTVASGTELSVFAAGGINLENVRLVLDAGVDGVAVTSAILKAKNPRQAASGFKKIIDEHGKKR